jgi:hypothetical protein
LFLNDELEGGVKMPFRFSVTSRVDELFAFRSAGDDGGLSVPGMCKSGFNRWAICLMNFMAAVLLPFLITVPSPPSRIVLHHDL